MTDGSNGVAATAAEGAKVAVNAWRIVSVIRHYAFMSVLGLVALIALFTGNFSEVLAMAAIAFCARYIWMSPLTAFKRMREANDRQ